VKKEILADKEESESPMGRFYSCVRKEKGDRKAQQMLGQKINDKPRDESKHPVGNSKGTRRIFEKNRVGWHSGNGKMGD